jgi:hypothetical protein
LKKVHDTVRRKALYNILTEFGIPMKLVQLCSNDTCSNVRISKHISHSLPIQNSPKQGDALSPLIFNFALEYARKGKRLKLLTYADNVNLPGNHIGTRKESTETLINVLEANIEKSKYMLLSHCYNAGQNRD